jgi:hypothetical protein
MTREETKTIMKKLGSAYINKNFEITQEVFDLWHECLREYEYGLAEKAAIHYIKEREFPPTIADIRKLCEEFKVGYVSTDPYANYQ